MNASKTNNFWSDNTTAVQLALITSAISGIFLNIQVPTKNYGAAEALKNMQFLVLFITSISISYLFVRLWVWVINIEKHFSGSGKYFENVLNAIVSAGGIFFLINLWSYLIRIYSDSIRTFFSQMTYVWDLLFFGVFFLAMHRFSKYFSNKQSKLMLFYIAASVAIGYSWALFNDLINWKANLRDTLLSGICLSVFLFLWSYFIDDTGKGLMRLNRKKVKADSKTEQRQTTQG